MYYRTVCTEHKSRLVPGTETYETLTHARSCSAAPIPAGTSAHLVPPTMNYFQDLGGGKLQRCFSSGQGSAISKLKAYSVVLRAVKLNPIAAYLSTRISNLSAPKFAPAAALPTGKQIHVSNSDQTATLEEMTPNIPQHETMTRLYQIISHSQTQKKKAQHNISPQPP